MKDTSLELLWQLRDLRDDRLKATHRHVLVALVMHRGAGGVIDPSVHQLVAATGLSRATLLRALPQLAEWGLIRIEPRGGHRPSHYELTLGAPPQTSPTETSGPVQTSHCDTSLPPERSQTDTSTTSQRSHDETSPIQRSQQRSHPRGPEVSNPSLRGLTVRPSEDLSEDLSEDPAPRARGAVVAIAPEPRADRLIDLGTARCERACEVYVQALLEAGWTRSQPRERWERQALVDAINTHLASGDDIHAALDELRRAVAEWVAAYRDRPTLSQGWSVRKFAEWLASARPTSSVRFRSEDAPTSQRARPQPSTAPEPDDEPFEPISPERQAEDQAFIESLARGGIPAPESHVNGEGMGVIRMPWFAASGAGR